MSSMVVALLQLRSFGLDEEGASERGERACREAARRGADVALFPELWQIGYSACPTDGEGRAEWASRATDESGDFVGRFRALAAELEMERPRGRGHLIAWVCLTRRGGCGVHAEDASTV